MTSANGRRVFSIPLRSIQPQTPTEPDVRYRDVYSAKYSSEGIDIRVDWDGDSDHFEILADDDVWRPIEDISVSPYESVVLANATQAGAVFHARFSRGPEHTERPFKVKLIEIKWKSKDRAELASWLSDTRFTAIRDTHYSCSTDPARTRIHESSDYDGKQWVAVEMVAGCDYEVWVELTHPTSDDIHVIDPIVRGGDGTGGP